MKNTLDSKIEPNQRENKNYGSIWLWCISEGYTEVPNEEEICFSKEGKITNFIIEFDKSKEDLLKCIHKAKSRYDYIYVVINDSSKHRELEKIIPDYCGIFCNSNAFGTGNVTQIFREAK